MNHVPSPLEWHPAYQDKTWLLGWLEGRGQYASREVMQMPVMPRLTAVNLDDLSPFGPTITGRITMTRQKCTGPAPWVGRPFIYVWPVGVDNLGRCIAGEAQIVYTSTWWPS